MLQEIINNPTTEITYIKSRGSSIIFQKWSQPECRVKSSTEVLKLIEKRDYALIIETVRSSSGKRLLVVDVDDGVNDNGKVKSGIATVKKLDLPPTLAQKSRSGNGLHLFYWIPESIKATRRISFYSDVDFLTAGLAICMRHQINNGRPVVDAPKWLVNEIMEYDRAKEQKNAANKERKEINRGSATTKCNYWCKNSIPKGKRDNYIFAYAIQNIELGVGDVEDHVKHMAIECDFDVEEALRKVERIRNGN